MRSLKSYNSAEISYDKLIEDNLVDSEAIKNKISLLICKGDIDAAIESLNKYIETNPADKESWLELADIYMRNLEYIIDNE